MKLFSAGLGVHLLTAVATAQSRSVEDIASPESIATRAEPDSSEQQKLVPRTFKLLGKALDVAPATAQADDAIRSSTLGLNDVANEATRIASQALPDDVDNVRQPPVQYRYRPFPFHLPDHPSGSNVVLFRNQASQFSAAAAIPHHRADIALPPPAQAPHASSASASASTAQFEFRTTGESSSEAALEEAEARRLAVVRRDAERRRQREREAQNDASTGLPDLNKIPKPPLGSTLEVMEEYRMAVYQRDQRRGRERQAVMTPESKAKRAAQNNRRSKKLYDFYRETKDPRYFALLGRAKRQRLREIERASLNDAQAGPSSTNGDLPPHHSP